MWSFRNTLLMASLFRYSRTHHPRCFHSISSHPSLACNNRPFHPHMVMVDSIWLGSRWANPKTIKHRNMYIRWKHGSRGCLCNFMDQGIRIYWMVICPSSTIGLTNLPYLLLFFDTNLHTRDSEERGRMMVYCITQPNGSMLGFVGGPLWESLKLPELEHMWP